MTVDQVIFTLGSSTRQPEEFIALLHHYRIDALVDIRRFPNSRRCPHFSRENLAALVESHGMGYHYLGDELGGYGTCRACGTYRWTMRHCVSSPSWARSGGTWHAYHVPLPWQCHRRFVAQALHQRGWRVRHIIDIDRECPPKADREWRVEQSVLDELTRGGVPDGDL